VLKVVGAPEGHGAALARAALYENARQVLGNGMRLLGIKPVDRQDSPHFISAALRVLFFFKLLTQSLGCESPYLAGPFALGSR
jgi:hypothetical protein